MIFQYPPLRESRRHGPRGYRTSASYRPWLRDEFAFRCIYCLKRERWTQFTGEFEIDHFVAQSVRPDLQYEYNNLVYSCSRCNITKQDCSIPNPFVVMTAENIALRPDGELSAATADARVIVRKLDLNSPAIKGWRRMWSGIVEMARSADSVLYRELVGFPLDLPRLNRLQPPAGNTRPEGIDESWFALQTAGKLPSSY